MLPLLLALALQAAGPADSVYASDSLRALVARAAATNRRVPDSLGGYRARMETEIDIVDHRSEGIEAAVQVEQVASAVRWTRDGAFEQRVVGYRAQMLGPTIASLSYFRQSWAVPVLYGNRLSLFLGLDTASRRDRDQGRQRLRRDSVLAVHPFAEDRERVYVYTGGDTVASLRVGGPNEMRVIRVVRVHVEPRRFPKGEPRLRTVIFRGDVDVDADRAQIVRMRGEFLAIGGSLTLGERMLGAGVDAITFADLENAEVQGRFWLPAYQRIELQARLSFTEGRSVLRLVSRFRGYELNDEGRGTGDGGREVNSDSLRVLPHRIAVAPRDSLERFDAWTREPGAEAAATNAGDFDDVAPDALRPTGGPRLELRGRHLSEWVRFNRVEGLFTGAAATLRMRDAAPGVEARASGGWAWSERAARGAVELSRQSAGGRWLWTLRGARTLAGTNDFTSKFDQATPFAVFGGDDYDYVDRRTLTLGVARELGGGASGASLGSAGGRPSWLVRLEGGPGRDGAVTRHVREVPIGSDTFRVNRPVAPGRYARAAAVVEWHPEVSAEFLQSGVGALVSYEIGRGGLDWQRLEARLLARRALGDVTLVGRLDGGLVVSRDPPPQQLFELGDEEGLPGYAYKAFAGDRAALARGFVMYSLPLLRAPIRLARRLYLPAPAPSPSLGIHAGWTGASPDARRAFDALNAPLDTPLWRATGHPRTTVDLTLRLFGGALTAGVARAIDRGERWRVVAGVGGVL